MRGQRTLTAAPAAATVLPGVAAPLPEPCTPDAAATLTPTATLPRGVCAPDLAAAAPTAPVPGASLAAAAASAGTAAPLPLLAPATAAKAGSSAGGPGGAANMCSSSLGSCGHASRTGLTVSGTDRTAAMTCSNLACSWGLYSFVPGAVKLVAAAAAGGSASAVCLPAGVACRDLGVPPFCSAAHMENGWHTRRNGQNLLAFWQLTLAPELSERAGQHSVNNPVAGRWPHLAAG